MNKKYLFCLIMLILITSICNAEVVINKTVTVDARTLDEIRDSLNQESTNYDFILDNNRSSFINIDVYDDLESSANIPIPEALESLTIAANKLNSIVFENSDIEFTNAINLINGIYSVQDIMDYFTGNGYIQADKAATRGLRLTYLCINVSYLYDCFFFKQYDVDGYPNTNVISAINILRQIMLESISLLEEAENFYEEIHLGLHPNFMQYQHGVWAKDFRSNNVLPHPGLNLHQYRLSMYGAAGLAALLIAETSAFDNNDDDYVYYAHLDDQALHADMIAMVDYIDTQLESAVMPSVFPDQLKKEGMLAFHTSNSGGYNESIGYAGFLLKLVTPYFVARNRLSAGMQNYFENPYIISWIKDMARKIVPAGGNTNRGYNWNYNDSSHNSGYYPSVLLFYYHAGNHLQAEKTDAAWQINCAKNNSGKYTRLDNGNPHYLLGFLFMMRYSSVPSTSPKVSDETTLPSYISDGAWSNSEFTILRAPANSRDEFMSSSSLNILHENSWGSAHAHADQSSYTFYHNGERYLLDSSGEFTDVHWWRISPYAHNMLVVDPIENDISGVAALYSGGNPKYRPVSGIQDFDKASFALNEVEPDPCHRRYFQSSPELDLLSVKLNYREAEQHELPIEEQELACKLTRSFLRYNDIYIVYDDVKTFEAPDRDSHDFGNLLHFDSTTVELDNDTYSMSKSKTVDFSCGSYNNFSVMADFDTLRTDGNPYLRGKQMITGASDPSFLTIIAPRAAEASRVIYKDTILNEIHCTAISGTSSSDPAVDTITFAGCTNGEIKEIQLGNNIIKSNGKLFIASKAENEASEFPFDRSMVLLDGNYLELNDMLLFDMYDDGVKGVTSTYRGEELSVTFHGAALAYPRFKILRSGADPDQFSAVMSRISNQASSEPLPDPDIPAERFAVSSVLKSLAYDNQYFYVNYSWSDLEAENLIDENLIFAKGEIPSTTLRSTLNIDGEVKITGTIVVRWDATLNIKENSIVFISDDVNIFNQGTINISGIESAPILITAATQAWGSILNVVGSTFICDWAVIEKASTGIMLRGIGQVTNSEIRNCDYGISIVTGTPFEIENNKIHLNTYGLSVSNSYTVSSLAHIAFNEICNNSFGILLYNSNPKMAGNDIHQNTIAGIQLVHASEPILEKNHIRNTGNNGMARPEILLESDSYPILDYGYNDINTDGFGYALYYDNIAGALPLRTLARENYWGSTNAIAIRHSIQPTSWNVIYSPFSLGPNTSFFNADPSLFQQALIAEDEGDMALAIQLYTSIVTTEPNSLYAVQSLGRLNSLYCKSPTQVGDLRFLYDSYLSTCSDNVLVQSATNKKIMLDRFDGLYDSAIQKYEYELLNNTSETDSLLYLLDIAYTMQEMYYADQSKSAHVVNSYHSHGLNISSLKDAEQEIEQLWEAILLKSDSTESNQIPVPTKLELSNYPNPFNPSTTISFTLPETGAVRMSIYNTRGQLVKDLIKEDMERGFHEVIWDGKNNNGFTVGTGMYFVRIETNKNSKSMKILLMK